MSAENEYRQFLVAPEEKNSPLFTEIPPPLPEPIEKAPAGLAPMSRIELDGRAYRGLASGNIPWWVLISGAVVFVLPTLGVIVAAADLGLVLVTLPILVVPAAIVWRGVSAKLAAKKEQEARLARRRRALRD
ncbi:MAG: hypothetical protein AAFY72_17360 [Cyanobacteria bacterium J06649_4]